MSITSSVTPGPSATLRDAARVCPKYSMSIYLQFQHFPCCLSTLSLIIQYPGPAMTLCFSHGVGLLSVENVPTETRRKRLSIRLYGVSLGRVTTSCCMCKRSLRLQLQVRQCLFSLFCLLSLLQRLPFCSLCTTPTGVSFTNSREAENPFLKQKQRERF